MFKPKDNPFARKSGSGFGASKKRKADHLVEVLAFDLAEHMIKGKNQFGEEAFYKIDKEAFDRCERSAASYKGGAKWMGHRIDEKMAAVIKVGRKVVMEQAAFYFKKDGLSVYAANKVLNSTAQSPSKLFTGLFSASRWEDRVNRVQHWEPQAFSLSDKEKLSDWVSKMEANKALQDEGKHIFYYGFQVRALRKEGEKWVCFDSTMPYESIPGDEDEKGNVKRLQITKETMLGILQEYREHLLENYKNLDTKWTVDIMPFRSFKASGMSPDMAIKRNSFGVIDLVDAEARCLPGDEETYKGSSTVVNGIIELTTDLKEEDPSDETKVIITKRDLVQALHANNWRVDSRKAVKSFDGQEVTLLEGMAAVRPRTSEEQARDSGRVSDALSALNGLQPKQEAEKPAPDGGWDDDDLFESCPFDK